MTNNEIDNLILSAKKIIDLYDKFAAGENSLIEARRKLFSASEMAKRLRISRITLYNFETRQTTGTITTFLEYLYLVLPENEVISVSQLRDAINIIKKSTNHSNEVLAVHCEISFLSFRDFFKKKERLIRTTTYIKILKFVFARFVLLGNL